MSQTSLCLRVSSEYLKVLMWTQWQSRMAGVDSSHTVHRMFIWNLHSELHCIWALIDSGTGSKFMASQLLNGLWLLQDMLATSTHTFDILVIMNRSVSSIRAKAAENMNHLSPENEGEVIFILLSTYDNVLGIQWSRTLKLEIYGITGRLPSLVTPRGEGGACLLGMIVQSHGRHQQRP